MPRRAKSQWDFGELFPSEEIRRVLTVGELTTQVRQLLEGNIGRIWVSGEISNLRLQPSGHCYFTLKDAAAQLACVLFRGEKCPGRELLEDRRSVILQGGLTVYEPRGQYQLRVNAIEVRGVGALQLAFERLKARLNEEGLFDAARKRALPALPRRLGIVTSATGAALRDVLHVLRRRFADLEILLAPCRVQGEGAAAEIARAIGALNDWSATATPETPLDLILVTRGGGSLEDLWAFNEEAVARAIAGSELPVVSAVGHEIDFTISDFVADLRAATPSAAAEVITEHLLAGRQFVDETAGRLPALARAGLTGLRQDLRDVRARLERVHPKRRIQTMWQRLDDLQGALGRSVRGQTRALAARMEGLVAVWRRLRPEVRVARSREQLAGTRQRLVAAVHDRLRDDRSLLGDLEARLRLLSPEGTLARGYSITRDLTTGRVIRSARETRSGQILETRVQTGAFRSRVE
ncbi:MAG: exodeoxyribonuclease VII large subunit [Verrucomicrobiales bacterium]|nr:exodeoxyribonuclease VII large subunit [Verrucomicrobiales bacterium]